MNLQIPQFSDSNHLEENIPHPIFKATLKYKDHTSIIAIKKTQKIDQVFCFCEASLNDVFKEMKRLEAKKPMQIIDILAKILKENADIS